MPHLKILSLLLNKVVFLLQTLLKKHFTLFSFSSCGVQYCVVGLDCFYHNAVLENHDNLKFYLLCLVQEEPVTSHWDSDLTRGFVTVTRTCLMSCGFSDRDLLT